MYVVFTKFTSNFIIFVFKFIFIFLDRLFEESFLEFKTINEFVLFLINIIIFSVFWIFYFFECHIYSYI